MPLRLFAVFSVFLFLAQPVLAKDVIGWVEKVRLYPGNLVVRAKIDSGAKTSSLNCVCNETFERDGESWLRFTIVDHQGRRHQFEKKIRRIAKIRRHFGKVQERYVVDMEICLAGKRKTVEMTLISREGFNYQMLIGRSALTGDFLIDPAHTFTAEPVCD